MNDMNKVRARGRIVGIGKDDYGHKRLVLYVRHAADGRPAYLSFAFGTALPLEVSVRNYVEIEGHICATSYHNEVWDRQSYMQYLVADKITLCKTRLEETFSEEERQGDTGFAYPTTYIDVALTGEIVRVTKSEQKEKNKNKTWVQCLLKVASSDTKKPHAIIVQYSDKMRVNDLKPEKGDRVCLVGLITSHKKQTQDKRRYRSFENIIVDDMLIVGKAAKEQSTVKEENDTEDDFFPTEE